MSIAWEAAIEAEISYRQQRVRADYHRIPRRHFFLRHHKIEPAASTATVTAMPLQKTGQSVAPVGHRHAA